MRQSGSNGRPAGDGAADPQRPNVPWIDSPFFEEELASRPGDRPSSVRWRSTTTATATSVIPNALEFRPHRPRSRRASTTSSRTSRPRQDRRFTDAWEFNGPAREIAVGIKVLDTLEFLYGRAPIPFQTLSFQRGTEQRGHADAIHFNSLPARFMCAVWVALEDIGPESGALFYHPGSHVLPEANPYTIGCTVDSFDYAAYEDYQAALMKTLGIEAQPFHAKKGDALLWSSNVVHGGSPILDPSSTRRSQVTHYFFEQCVYYTPMFSDVAAGEYYVRSYMIDIRTAAAPVTPTTAGRSPSAPSATGGAASTSPPVERTGELHSSTRSRPGCPRPATSPRGSFGANFGDATYCEGSDVAESTSWKSRLGNTKLGAPIARHVDRARLRSRGTDADLKPLARSRRESTSPDAGLTWGKVIPATPSSTRPLPYGAFGDGKNDRGDRTGLRTNPRRGPEARRAVRCIRRRRHLRQQRRVPQ